MSAVTKTPVGEIRPSQLIWTYGPGALVDLPNISVVTLGLDRWERDRCSIIREPRLLAAVRRSLGPQVEDLRRPPVVVDGEAERFSAEGLIGVPVRPFPRWMRCVKCGMLSSVETGLFSLKEDRYRPERTRFVHKDCKGSKGDHKARDADAVPARFLLACRAGHLDDFPWHYYAHTGSSTCKGSLRFFESGASLQTENLWVKCDQCGAARSMAMAFGKPGKENLPACRGRHPHLDHFDSGCKEEARTVLLGSTNSWFPVLVSALAIPLTEDPLSELVREHWDQLADLDSPEEIPTALKLLRKSTPAFNSFDAPALWSAIEKHRSGDSAETVEESEIREPEWQTLTAPSPPSEFPHFTSEVVSIPAGFEVHLERVLLLKRLREVNALLGFTRVEAPEEAATPDDHTARAALAKGKMAWVPANEVHGEGIFMQFAESTLQNWEKLPEVTRLAKQLLRGHRAWRAARKLNPHTGFYGVRYAMLHTLAHLLIRELALECGYNAASIRERVYGDTTDGKAQAGILIYTAAADSDGTLGGLVELGKPDNLGRLLRLALARARVCSSDPLCSEHDPEKDRSLHGAACHACTFVAETSCERGNRYLGRTLLVPTLESQGAAFFKGNAHELATSPHPERLVGV